MKLYQWKLVNATNFGDELGVMIVSKILGRTPPITDDPTDSNKMLGLGSVLNTVRNGDVVWGSGFRGGKWDIARPVLKAVRGPITKQMFRDKDIFCPEVYGDPALLLAKLFPEIKPTKKYKKTTVLHFSEGVGDISAHRPAMEVLNRLIGSEMIESSALHPLIVADVYGIPARWLDGKEPKLKYYDYFLSTGRTLDVKPGDVLPPPRMPDLNALLNAFPYDAFNLS